MGNSDASAVHSHEHGPDCDHDHEPLPTGTVAAWVLTGLLGSAGVGHFVSPAFFDAIVPEWVPISARATTYASGVVELGAAALLANPRTRRLGGWVAAATFIGVFPANIQAALDGGMKDLDPPMNSAAVAWARLPLQIPMIWAALRVARGGKG